MKTAPVAHGTLSGPAAAGRSASRASVPRRPSPWPLLGAFLLGAALPASAQQAPAPGDSWQQEVSYDIEARLDEEAQVVRGAARMEYRNRSPDVLEALFFHLHLNAFRPGSVWARNEQRPQYDFSSLEDPDHAFERLRSVRIGGEELVPTYPHAPDSTVVRLDLPESLEPGEAVTVELEWDARPSTLCRRQCRQGRHWDLAQWYPRVAVYDRGGWQANPLHPQGEFYGEFARWDVTLDLPGDQVVGATGVPVSGDPGWRPAPTASVSAPPYNRSWYGAAPERPALGLLAERPETGRKRVRFLARRAHHFAWSVNPEYRYEGGRHGEVAVHVLFRPGDLDWDLDAAVRRTVRALQWLEGIFGPYPYPQLTNLHRLEDGGTEFPMVIMDGGPGQGLIVHETAHQYVHGILANNEWRQAWLDEGLTSFLTTWFAEEHGAPDPWTRTLDGLADLERRGPERPIDTPSHEFSSYGAYGVLSYTRASAVFYMLREMLGEEAFREGLRSYYRQKRFEHVTGDDLRRAFEETTGRDLGWFFEQWLSTTATLDYRIGDVSTERTEGGAWSTRVEVVREGEAWMPVTVQVGDERRRLESRERTQVVRVETAERPERVVLDPDRMLLDADPSNNRRELEGG